MKVQIIKATVNGVGHTHAAALVSDGKVDKNSDWSFSAEDGNKLLGSDGKDWSEYAKWFMSVDSSEPADSKTHYGYPFGKNGKVYRSAIIAIKSRAAQQKEDTIYNIADQLLQKIDGTDKSKTLGMHQKAWSTLKITSIKCSKSADDDDESNFDEDQDGRSDEDDASDEDADSGKSYAVCEDCGEKHDPDEDCDPDDIEDMKDSTDAMEVFADDDAEYDEEGQRKPAMERGVFNFMRKKHARVKVKSVRTKKDTAVDDAPAMVIEGIASTPSTDRVGDIVESLGAQFKLPLPFLWQHDSLNPIGQVVMAEPTEDGIPVRIEIPDVKEPGLLRDRLQYAMACLKYGLVKGLSIGFAPVEYSYMEDTGGIRFVKWAWYELSGVTIAANQDASIAAIKALDMKRVDKHAQKKRPTVNLSKFRREDLAQRKDYGVKKPLHADARHMEHMAEFVDDKAKQRLE